MAYPEITLLRLDWQEAILPWALLLVHLWEGHPLTTATPMMRKKYPLILLPLRCGGKGNQGHQSGSDSDETRTSGGRHKKKDGFSSKIHILEFGGKKGHPHDMADAFR